MIDQLNKQNSPYINSASPYKQRMGNPNFKGGFTELIQHCEKKPMLNVAVIDLLTAIIPRSVLDFFRNVFAGFETLRRESSGLIVNCLIPGFITLGYAKLLNSNIMGKNKADMSSCWASSDTLKTVVGHYDKAETRDAFQEGLRLFNGNKEKARVYSVNHALLSDAHGIDGFDKKHFKDILSKDELSQHAKDLTNALFENSTNNIVKDTPKQKLKEIFNNITNKTHIAQNVTFGKEEKALTANLENVITDSHQILKGILKENLAPGETKDFLARSKKLLKTKSGLGMLTILPLALSMQYINRKITEKSSGVKGAPIHEGYAQSNHITIEKSPEQQAKEKKELLQRKILAVSSMFGVAMLSMMKLPNMQTLKDIIQFKDRFPTMNQARAISSITFGSRMAVADDKADLNEHWTRDLVTFSSMYFLGDYGAKAAASIMEKKHGVELLNKTYDKNNNQGIFKKIKNWVLHTHLKSSDELKGVGEELKFAKKLRTNAQLTNIGTSLLLLGVMVPLYTMFKTRQSDEKERLALEKQENTVQNVNFKYSELNSDDKFVVLKNFKSKVVNK